jgi:hypothetical protein
VWSSGETGEENNVYNSNEIGFGNHFQYTWNSLSGANLSTLSLRSYLYFDIYDVIKNTTIEKAILKLDVRTSALDKTTYEVNPVNSTWDESTLTHNNAPPINNELPPSLVESPALSDTSWEVDIKHIVQGWADGSMENHGIRICDADDNYPPEFDYNVTYAKVVDRISYFNSSNSEAKPQLELKIRHQE